MIKNKRSLRSVDLQKGQVVVLLLLVVVIALAVGLSTINRSTLEVSTSKKSEDSSRAFSAAEAGMERIIEANKNNLGGATQISVIPPSFDNQSSATIITAGLPVSGKGLAYPPFGKESFAQFWLVDSGDITKAKAYSANTYDIYFGDPSPNGDLNYYATYPDEKPAIEVNTIYWDGSSSKYLSQSNYYDSFGGTMLNARSAGFNGCSIPVNSPSIQVNTDVVPTTPFYCKAIVNIGSLVSGSSFPVMVRVRILYSSLSHPVAIYPATGASISPQANIYISKGTSGSVQRTLKVFTQKAVMPQFFNYALFSAAELTK